MKSALRLADTAAQAGKWESAVESLNEVLAVEPENAEVQFRGALPLRTCVKDSINVPAIRVAEAVGIDLEDEALGFTYDLPANFTMPYPLPAGFSFDVDVTFAPTLETEADTNIVFTSNDPQQPTAAAPSAATSAASSATTRGRPGWHPRRRRRHITRTAPC